MMASSASRSTAAAATAADVQAEPTLLTDTEASDILRKWGASTTDLADLADLLGRTCWVDHYAFDEHDNKVTRIVKISFANDGAAEGGTLWHAAAWQGNIEMCRWIKAKGMLGMISTFDDRHNTPFMAAMSNDSDRHEKTARWIMVNCDPDLAAMDSEQRTTYVHKSDFRIVPPPPPPPITLPPPPPPLTCINNSSSSLIACFSSRPCIEATGIITGNCDEGPSSPVTDFNAVDVCDRDEARRPRGCESE